MAQTAPLEHSGLELASALLHGIREALALDERDAANELALAETISRGLPARALEALMQHGVPEADIYRLIIPRRTFQRRRKEKEALTPGESDRAERTARILALARAVLGDTDRAVHWLVSPKAAFGMRRPLDLTGSSVGAKLVEKALLQAYFGNVA